MTNIEKILVIANKIANEGKKPTVALIKSRFPGSVPLPQIISALKSWQHEPDNCTFEDESVNDSDECIEKKEYNASDTLTVGMLNDALTPIKKELAELKALLKELTES